MDRLADADVHEVAIDNSGTIWVSLAGGNDLMYLPRGERRFSTIGQHVGARLLEVGPDGAVFASGPQGINALLTRGGLPEKVVQISSQALGRVLADP